MKNEKILIMLNSLDLGGSQTYAITLANEFVLKGYGVSIAAKGGAFVEKAKALNIKFYDVRIDAGFRWEKDSFLKYISKFIFIYVPAIFSMISIAKRERFGVIIVQQPAPTFIAILLRKFFGVPILSIVHHTLGNEFPPLFYKTLKYKLPQIIAISQEIKDHLVKNWRVDSASVSVLLNCMDLKEFPMKTTSDVYPRKIIYVSQLHAGKMHAVESFINSALIVYGEYQDVEFCLVGGGAAFNDARKMAADVNAKIGKEAVKVIGGQTEVARFISGASLFIGIARSAREAMAMGVPVILAGHLKGPKGGNYAGIVAPDNIGELEYYNLSGRNSNVVSTPEILAQDILKLLKDQDYAKKISLFGREYIEKFCSSVVIADNIEKQIKILMGENNG